MARECAGRSRVLVLFSKDVSAPAEDLIRSHRAEEFQVWVWHCPCLFPDEYFPSTLVGLFLVILRGTGPWGSSMFE